MKTSGFKPKPCPLCGSIYHTKMMCSWKRGTPLRKAGKVAEQWKVTKDKWLQANKSAYYFCYYCDKLLTRTQLTLDHMESRSRRPDLRNSVKNLVPCCWKCNTEKGSRSALEYKEYLDETHN